MSCGIYRIINKINGHSYIGLSNNIEKRFKDHISKAFNLNDKEKDNVLYKAIRKYGKDNFYYEILEECPPEQLKEKEIYYINLYNTYKNREDYNETPGGDLVGERSIHKGENHGKAILTDEEVIFCRKCYSEGLRSRNIWEQYFKSKISYDSFLKVWHGQTWKHIMPEVFKNNPHRGRYTFEDCQKIRKLYYDREKPITLNEFLKTEECFVGYGTLWKMINNPEFYKNK